MTHVLFQKHPWFHEPAALPNEPAGMLGRHEAMLFYYLAKEAYSGHGTIVDAGSFLGKSAFFFAQGLRANPGFDAARHRVHCFDNFLVNDELTIEFIRNHLRETLSIGESTRAIFERQAAPVRELLEVHAGDFHTVPWTRQPIEILMVDIAKTESLGKRVVEVFFPDLVPGLSIVVHQDYHHPWLPHIHVVMEYLAGHFQLLAPRVDDSAAFLLTTPIPPAVLQRAIVYDFTHDEQLALMDRAIQRLPAGDRHFVEFARLLLRSRNHDYKGLRGEFESIERRHAEQKQDHDWARYLESVRDFVDEREGWQERESGNFARTLQLADGLIARGKGSTHILVMRATALMGLGRHAEAVPVLRETLNSGYRNGWAYIELARALAHLGRIDEAEDEIERGLLDRLAVETRPRHFFEMLGHVWEHKPRPKQVADFMARLHRELPAEPELWVMEARVNLFVGKRREAAQSLRKACELGLAAERCAEVRQQAGIAAAEWTAVGGR